MEGAIQHMFFSVFRNMICLWVCKFGLDCIDGDEDIKHASCIECEKNLLVFSALCF